MTFSYVDTFSLIFPFFFDGSTVHTYDFDLLTTGEATLLKRLWPVLALSTQIAASNDVLLTPNKRGSVHGTAENSMYSWSGILVIIIRKWYCITGDSSHVSSNLEQIWQSNLV